MQVLRWRPTRLNAVSAAELLVAFALLAEALVEIWGSNRVGNGWGGPRGVASVLATVIACTVIARARRPAVHAVVAVATCGVLIALVAPRQAPFAPFVALVLTFYALAAHAAPRKSVAILAVTLASGIALIPTGVQDAGTVVPGLVWIAAAWVVGRLMRSRAERTLRLEEINVQLVGERDERAKAAVAHERARIARELHDVVAHNVSVMVVHAGAGARTLEGEQPIVREALSTIETVGRQTVEEMRRLVGILREEPELATAPPPSLKHIDLLVEQARGAGLEVELAVHGEHNGLAAGLDLAGYRIVQEALTNTLKHAGRVRAQVTVRYGADGLSLEVVDDGTAPSPTPGDGHGLVGMNERVALYGGTLDAGPRPEGGYRVVAHLPTRGAR